MKKILALASMVAACAAVFAVFSTSDADAQLPAVHGNQRWVLVRNIGASDVQTDGGTKTITADDLVSGTGGLVVDEFLVREKVAFVHTDLDGGAQTLVMDIGKSGALERFAKDVSLKQTAGTVTLGSGTTSVKPRNYEADGTNPVITIVSGNVVDPLSRVTAGRVEIWALVSNVPR